MATHAATAWQQAHDALQALKQQLEAACEAATADSVIDAIDLRADAVDDALTAMSQVDMKTHTIALQAAAADVAKPLQELDQLKAELAAVGNDMKKASAALARVDSIVSSVLSSFGLEL